MAIKRVPLDFNWPHHMPWKGYVMPYSSQMCEACEQTGYNPATYQLYQDWYNWQHKLTQDEVDALTQHGRLGGEYGPGVFTAEAVNDWNLKTIFGHDDINRMICVEARAKRLGVFGICPICNGDGEVWFNDRIKQLADDWLKNESYDPPTGDGWQLWESVSEGSPLTPVFSSQEELDIYIAVHFPHKRKDLAG